MTRLENLIQKLCPDGVEYVKISSVVNYEQPNKYIVKSTDYSNNFSVPVLTAGQTFILGYTDEKSGIYNASEKNPVIIFDDFTGAFKWVDFPFKVKSSAMKILTSKDECIKLRFIYHVMGNIGFSSDEHKRLWISLYSQFKIPLPPFEIQEKIVTILDNFTRLISELERESELRKKQYAYFRDRLLMFDAHRETLGDVCEIITKGTTPEEFTESGVNFIKTEAFYCGRINKEKLSHVSEETHYGFLKRSILKKGDILFAIAGTIGKCALIEEEILPANTNQASAIIRVKREKVLEKYVMYVIQSYHMLEYMKKNIKGSAQPNLTLKIVSDFSIPVPPLSEQERIVKILDKFDKLCNDTNEGLPAEIEKRQKQYQYYRDKLLKFRIRN